jgi:hypothetical protein
MASQMSSAGSGSGGGGNAIKLIVTDSGSATPSGGIVNVIGGSNVSTSEITNNAIINLDDDITITSAIIGDVEISGNSIETTDTDQNLLLIPSGAGAVSIEYLNQSSIIVTDSFSDLTDVGVMTDGQLAIGSTGNTPVASTLTEGSGISITNGAGSITINSTGSGGAGFIEWQKIVYNGTGQQSYTMERNKGYITDSNQAYVVHTTQATPYFPVFLTLPDPDDLQVGDVVAIASMGSGRTAILIPNDDSTVMPYNADPSTGFQALQYPGGLTSNARSAIWLQYVGRVFISSGIQRVVPTWIVFRVQGMYQRQTALPNANYRLT